jgi:pimeloyl-ACP methyl ester carboxylesterase
MTSASTGTIRANGGTASGTAAAGGAGGTITVTNAAASTGAINLAGALIARTGASVGTTAALDAGSITVNNNATTRTATTFGNIATQAFDNSNGNGGNISDRLSNIGIFHRLGISTFVFDYRGYGRSDDARPTRDTLVRDAHAALDFVLSRADLDPKRVGVLGMSLGGVAGSYLASERAEIRSLALVSAFTSWGTVANDHVPILGRLLVRPGHDPLDAVAKLGARPLLLLHGEQDRVVPVSHSRQLAEAARVAGLEPDLVLMPEADHNDILDSRVAQRKLAEFFSRTLGPLN